jgi:hypothetical protein
MHRFPNAGVFLGQDTRPHDRELDSRDKGATVEAWRAVTPRLMRRWQKGESGVSREEAGMRRTPSLLPLVVSLLVPITAHPQDGVHLEFLAGPLFEPSHVYANQYVGWTAGIGLSYDLSSAVQAIHSVSFCRFPNGDWTETAYYFIENTTGSTSAAKRVFHDGYEVAAGIRVGAPSAQVGSYLSLRVGVQSAKRRRKSSFVWPSEPSGHHWDWVTNGFTCAGVGVTVPVQGGWRLLVEGRLTMGTNGETVFVPLTAGLQLRL